MIAAIIGTRSPTDLQRKGAFDLAAALSSKGHTIRTGGAFGSDQAAMEGSAMGEGILEVYPPWAKYNAEIIPTHAEIIVYNPKLHEQWTHSVDINHPNPSALSRGGRALHARNYGIISGADAVFAFPKSVAEQGGTGQGLRIAYRLKIPYVEMYVEEPCPVEKIMRFIKAGMGSQDYTRSLMG